MTRPETNTERPDETGSAAPSAAANAFVYLVIQKPTARGCLPALVSSAIPVISLDGVDTTIVTTWNPPPSLRPPK